MAAIQKSIARSFKWLDQGLRDLRHAGRTLRRSPGFAAVAVLTLALAIGAVTALFTVLDGVVLRPLAYPDSDRIVSVINRYVDRRASQLTGGDEIDVETRYGVYRYRVTGSQVVNPDNRTVLVPNSDGYHLTLTTCWPLWAGAFATQRYVIFTDQVWPIPIRHSYT